MKKKIEIQVAFKKIMAIILNLNQQSKHSGHRFDTVIFLNCVACCGIKVRKNTVNLVFLILSC